MLQAIAATVAEENARIDALFRDHVCESVYLDVGTNIGVQLRKLFEPHRFEGAPVLPVFSAAFGDDRWVRGASPRANRRAPWPWRVWPCASQHLRLSSASGTASLQWP